MGNSSVCWLCRWVAHPSSASVYESHGLLQRKGFYSVILQAVVDHNLLFTDLFIGWPGSVHDARVLANSALYRRCNSKEWLQGDSLRVNNTNLSIFLIGDSAYPLLPWLIKPFSTSPSLSLQQKTFNYRICRGRVVVELAFGRLKARWRRLLKRNDMLVTNVPNVIAACCTLHNICEVHGDVFDEEWLEDCESDEDGTQPTATTCSTSTSTCPDSEEVREVLVNYFVQNPL